MKRIDFSPAAGRSIAEYESHGALWNLLPSSDSSARIGVMRYSPGAVLGAHPAGLDQLFIVVAGSGWVKTGDGPRETIAEDEAVLWYAGEMHESGSDAGMIAVIIQAEEFDQTDKPST